MSAVTDGIYERIYVAIVEQALPPGTKLGEESLCEVFGVSRTRIRRVLQRLANDHVIELLPNRGAYVARPSVDEARDIFATRRLLEADVVRRLAGRLSLHQRQRLEEQVAAEADAHSRGDRRAAIRLSGQFHLLLADMAGNRVVSRFLRELVSRTSLIIALYEAPGASCCPFEEHAALMRKIAGGPREDAVAAMTTHLEGIEARLRLQEPPGGSVDLLRVFRDSMADDQAGSGRRRRLRTGKVA